MKSNLNWDQLKLALAYKVISGKSHIRSIRWVNRHYKEFMEFSLVRHQYGLPLIRNIKPKYAKKELIAQGFIPISQFKMRERSGKYAYLITNELLPGEKLIFPEHFTCGLKKGYRNIYSEGINGYGVEGYVRVYLTKYKNGYAK